MRHIHKMYDVPKSYLTILLIIGVICGSVDDAAGQTSSDGGNASELENQVVLAMDAANKGSADLALFYLVLHRWFPNPAKDPGYRGAAGTDRFRLEKGGMYILCLAPIEAFDPDDGTVSLWWNIWSEDPVLIDGVTTSEYSPVSGGSGDLHMQQYTIVAPKVEIIDADVTRDEIQLRLEPRGVTGTLTLELTDPDTHVIQSEERPGSAGIVRETFDINNLAVGEYEKVKATWNVGGAIAEDEFAFPEGRKLDVLGPYEHTQYNTPREADFSGNVTSACLIIDNQCTYQQITLRSDFLEAALLNGNGTSINHGRLQWGAWCANNGYPPPAACAPAGEQVRTFEVVNAYEGACESAIITAGTTVAVGLDEDDLSPLNPDNLACGDRIFIYHPDYPELQVIKTVTDRCPGCINERHVDNYIGEGGNPFTYPNNPMTIRFF